MDAVMLLVPLRKEVFIKLPLLRMSPIEHWERIASSGIAHL
jgi:hypothetical protein